MHSKTILIRICSFSSDKNQIRLFLSELYARPHWVRFVCPFYSGAFWRSLWTFPPWKICAQILKKVCTCRGFWNRFLQDTLQVDWRTKVWITKRLLHGPLRNRNSPTDEPILDGRPIDPTILRKAQDCPVLVFPLQNFLCWTFRNCDLRNKALACVFDMLSLDPGALYLYD